MVSNFHFSDVDDANVYVIQFQFFSRWERWRLSYPFTLFGRWDCSRFRRPQNFDIEIKTWLSFYKLAQSTKQLWYQISIFRMLEMLAVLLSILYFDVGSTSSNVNQFFQFLDVATAGGSERRRILGWTIKLDCLSRIFNHQHSINVIHFGFFEHCDCWRFRRTQNFELNNKILLSF